MRTERKGKRSSYPHTHTAIFKYNYTFVSILLPGGSSVCIKHFNAGLVRAWARKDQSLFGLALRAFLPPRSAPAFWWDDVMSLSRSPFYVNHLCFSISRSQGEASLPPGRVCSETRDYQRSSHPGRWGGEGRGGNCCSPSRNLDTDGSSRGSLMLHESERKRAVTSAAERLQNQRWTFTFASRCLNSSFFLLKSELVAKGIKVAALGAGSQSALSLRTAGRVCTRLAKQLCRHFKQLGLVGAGAV